MAKNTLMFAHNLEKNFLAITMVVYLSIFLFGLILIQITVMG